MDPTRGRGLASPGWRRLSVPYLEAWRDFRFVADEYRELDDHRVLVLYHFFGQGKTSGVELDKVRTKAAHVFHVDEGRVAKLVIYLDRQRALADLGLEA